MNPIQELAEWVKGLNIPNVSVRPEIPPVDLVAGVWWLDIIYPGGEVVIEWGLSGQADWPAANPFGLSNIKPGDDRGYGERPDEAFDSIQGIQERLTNILT